jgi:uncharacterized protein GlcG (DUF336 family)
VNLKAKSLKTYQEKFKPEISVRTSMSDYKNELMLVDGGNNLGNTMIVVGGILISIGCPGFGGIVAGAVCSGIGLLSGWE